tara:strand:+ start:1029 stop:1289 length:261 start_codon:yes stop_codon:yes gene_type:complete
MTNDLMYDIEARLDQLYLDANREARQMASQYNESLAANLLDAYITAGNTIAAEIFKIEPNADVATVFNSVKTNLKLEIDEGIRYSV